MTTPPKTNKEFWAQLAIYAFESYLKRGIGVCIFKEQPATPATPATKIKNATLKYLPYDHDNSAFTKFPPETLTMLDEYDPKSEVIFVIVDKDAEALVMQLSALKLGGKPIDAYRDNQRKNGMGAFIPGELLSLKKDLPDLVRGQYIFLKRTGAMMELSPAGIDPLTDEICRTEDIVKCHADYEECFEGGEVIVGTKE